jgi:hypothetical protein
MATLSKTLMPRNPAFYEVVKATPDSDGDIAFDSTFELPSAPGLNCSLRITLRIFCHKVDPPQVTVQIVNVVSSILDIPSAGVGFYPDWDSKPNLIKPWTPAQWTNFINVLKNQASPWDSKFWLVPPDDFVLFDQLSPGGAKMRPNVKCEFSLEFAPFFFPGVHREINVVNLATNNFFRSDSSTYSSGAVSPQYHSAQDQTGAMINTQQLTFTHEFGHALGLDHIGQLLNFPDCGIAIALGSGAFQQFLPAQLKGGIGASVCYGPGHSADAINNVMGQGMRFSAEDAQPWLVRLPEHLNLSGWDGFNFAANLPKWRVQLKDTPPRAVR